MTRFALIAVTFSLVTSAAHALSTAPTGRIVPEGTVQAEVIEGKVLSVNHAVPKCDPHLVTPCNSKTRIEIEFTLGCADDVIVNSSTVADDVNETLDVTISALQLVNKQSAVVRCVRANKKVATIFVSSHLRQLDPANVRVTFAKFLADVTDAP